MQKTLEQLVENVSSNIPGYVAISVTEISSGESLIANTTKDSFDPELASAYNLEVVKAKLKAIEALGLDESIRDIAITLNDQIHIINIAPSGGYFIYLAIDSKKANLAITRTLLNKYKEELNKAL